MIRKSVRNEKKDSVQAHTIEERNHVVVVLNEPLKVLLEDTLTRAAVLLKNSIEARLCGIGAIATGVKFNPGLTNASNQMTVQIHIAGVSIRNDLSVCTLEVNTFGDGSVHLAFDFPHESKEKGLVVGGGVVPSPSCGQYTTAEGPLQGGLCSLVDWHKGVQDYSSM